MKPISIIKTINIFFIIIFSFLVGMFLKFGILPSVLLSFIGLALYYILSLKKNYIELILYIISAYLPFYALIRSYGLVNNSLLLNLTINYLRDFLIVFAFIVIMIKNSRHFNYKLTLYSISYTKILAGIFLLIVNYIYGFLISIIRGHAILGVKGIHLNLIPILLVLIVYNISSFDKKTIDKYIKLIIDIGVIVALIGFYFYIYKPSFFGEFFAAFRMSGEASYEVLNYSRMVSVFFSPNVFGAFMSITIVLSFSEFISSKKNSESVYFIFSFVLTFVALVLSMSRGAWLSSLIGIIIVTYYNSKMKRQNKRFLKVLMLLVLLLISFIFISPEIKGYLAGRFDSIIDFENQSSYGRMSSWASALEILKQNISGLGLGVGGINMAFYSHVSNNLGIEVIDGFYIKIMVETGFAGVLLFCGFLFCLINSLRYLTIAGKDEHKKYYIVTLAIFVGAALQSFGSNVFDFVAVAPFIWIFIGISLKLASLEK